MCWKTGLMVNVCTNIRYGTMDEAILLEVTKVCMYWRHTFYKPTLYSLVYIYIYTIQPMVSFQFGKVGPSQPCWCPKRRTLPLDIPKCDYIRRIRTYILRPPRQHRTGPPLPGQNCVGFTGTQCPPLPHFQWGHFSPVRLNLSAGPHR